VLVSNAKIANFKDTLKKYSFDQLCKQIKDKIESLESIRNNGEILQNIYFLRCPPLLEISSIIVSELVYALKQRQHNFRRIKDDLLSYIDNMCPGATDIEDMKIINDNETYDYNLKHKTITKEQIQQIIENNQVHDAECQEVISVGSSITMGYDIINASHPNEEQLVEIHEFIDEY
jgi:hypothetical protein